MCQGLEKGDKKCPKLMPEDSLYEKSLRSPITY